jgi:hypothetical protein
VVAALELGDVRTRDKAVALLGPGEDEYARVAVLDGGQHPLELRPDRRVQRVPRLGTLDRDGDDGVGAAVAVDDERLERLVEHVGVAHTVPPSSLTPTGSPSSQT